MFASQNALLVIPPLLVDLADEFSVSVAVAGQLGTATFAAWAVAAAMVGPLSDSFGRRPVALGGLSLLTVGLIASAFAPNMETLLALRVMTGLGAGMIPTNSVSTVADVISPTRRAMAVSGLMASNAISPAVSVPVIALAAEWAGWRLPFLGCGVLAGTSVMLSLVWFPKDDRARRAPFTFFSRYRSLFTMSFFRAVVAVVITQRIAFWGMFSFYAAYLIDAYGLSVGAIAIPLALSAIGQGVGTLSAALVANRRQRLLLVAACSVAGGLCAAVVFSTQFSIWADVAIAFVGIGLMSVAVPVMLTASTEVSGRSRATGVALVGLSNQIGGVGAAAFGGVVLANTNFSGIGYLCFGVSVLSALTMALFMRGVTGPVVAEGTR